jgi:hypothetical protein
MKKGIVNMPFFYCSRNISKAFIYCKSIPLPKIPLQPSLKQILQLPLSRRFFAATALTALLCQ